MNEKSNPTSRRAQEPIAVADYFRPMSGPVAVIKDQGREHAVVVETFASARGWVREPFRKRISPTWARKARNAGVTAVALASAGRVADFRIEELTR